MRQHFRNKKLTLTSITNKAKFGLCETRNELFVLFSIDESQNTFSNKELNNARPEMEPFHFSRMFPCEPHSHMHPSILKHGMRGNQSSIQPTGDSLYLYALTHVNHRRCTFTLTLHHGSASVNGPPRCYTNTSLTVLNHFR